MLAPHGDARRQLVAIEEIKDIFFYVRRGYYRYDVAMNITRGFHAYKSIEQILICVHGSCKIKLDDGKKQEIIALDKPNEWLHVSNVMWREMFDFSPDAALLILASELYDEKDYIRNHGEFLKYVGANVVIFNWILELLILIQKNRK